MLIFETIDVGGILSCSFEPKNFRKFAFEFEFIGAEVWDYALVTVCNSSKL